MKLNKKLSLGLVSVTAIALPVATVISCGGEKLIPTSHRIFTQFQSSSSFDFLPRVWDYSFQSKDMAIRAKDEASIPQIFRQHVLENSKVEISPGGIKKLINPAKEKVTFDSVNKVTVHDTSNNVSKFTDFDSLEKALPSQTAIQFDFEVNDNVYYVNSKGEKTKYKYKAIDLFYGFMRGVYNSQEVREKGSIVGKQSGLPKFDSEYLKKFNTDPQFLTESGALDKDHVNNGNTYLLNLYGVDVAGTIDANTGTNYNPDNFSIKFNSPQSKSILINFFAHTSKFYPVSSQKILELNNNEKDFQNHPGKFLGIIEYGQSRRDGTKYNLDDELTVARFYYSSYDIGTYNNGSKGIILKKNPYSYDTDYNQNPKTLLEARVIVYPSVLDEDTFALERLSSFITDNSESALSSVVIKYEKLKKEAARYIKTLKQSQSGLIGHTYTNPAYMLLGPKKLDDNTSKLLFGYKTSEVIDKSDADEQYWTGRGMTFRALLNNSVNLYGLSKESSPASSQKKTARNFNPSEPIASGLSDTFDSEAQINPKFGISYGAMTDKEAENWYLNPSHDETNIALRPGNNYDDIKKAWANFISKSKTDLSLTGQGDVFTYPLYDYIATDAPLKGSTKSAYAILVKYLNELTAGTGIRFEKFEPTQGKNLNLLNKQLTAPSVYIGGGDDYGSALSTIQQIFSANYGIAIGPSIFSKILENGKADTFDSTLKDYSKGEMVDFLDFRTWLNNNSSDFPNLIKPTASSDLEALTLGDWMKYKSSSFDDSNQNDKNAKKLFNELTNALQKYFYVASNDKSISIKWIKYFADLNLGNKLFMGYPAYSASSSPYIDKGGGILSTTDIYTKDWIMKPEPPSLSHIRENWVDIRING